MGITNLAPLFAKIIEETSFLFDKIISDNKAKTYFLKSIPAGLKEMRTEIDQFKKPKDIHHLLYGSGLGNAYDTEILPDIKQYLPTIQAILETIERLATRKAGWTRTDATIVLYGVIDELCKKIILDIFALKLRAGMS